MKLLINAFIPYLLNVNSCCVFFKKGSDWAASMSTVFFDPGVALQDPGEERSDSSFLESSPVCSAKGVEGGGRHKPRGEL